MIITGEQIKEAVAHGTIRIDPYVEANVQPASIDLTLGSEVKVYASQVSNSEVISKRGGEVAGSGILRHTERPMDPKEPQNTISITMPESGFLIKPDVLYLMHTHERVWTQNFVSVLDGKSSIGRLGVVVHLTAGYGDPGFDGQYTLEVTCVHPVILYPGMKIAQMRFHVMYGEAKSYADKGHYTGAGAVGAVGSMAHKQF